MRQILRLWNPQQAHQVLREAWPVIKSMLMAGHRLVVEIRTETRTLAQNARLWALLTEVSQQVEWYGRKLSPTDWKDMFTAVQKKQDVVPGIDGGFVVLGASTSRMTIAEMCDLQTLIEAFCADRGVQIQEHIDPETGEIT